MVFNKSLYGVFVLMGFCVLLSVSVHADSESGGWHITNCPENHYLDFPVCNYFAYDFDVSGPIDEPHHFIMLSGPGTIDPYTGVYVLAPGELSEPQWIEIAVIDEDGRGDECNVHLTPVSSGYIITNCPEFVMNARVGFTSGYMLFSESDCTYGRRHYEILDRDGIVGELAIDGIGQITFVPDSADVGHHTVLVAAADAYSVGTPCTVEFEVFDQAEYAVRIDVENRVIQGTEVIVDVTLDPYEQALTGFAFLFSYPAGALAFFMADTIGASAFASCDWEYFTYRPEFFAEPSSIGLFRVVAIADINNGDIHPDLTCDISGSLFRMRFFLTGDATYECQYLPIQFYWRDCDDNTLSGTPFGGPYVSRRVFVDFDGAPHAPVQIDNLEASFPTPYGYQSDECPIDIGFGGSGQTHTVDFYNGGVQVICAAQLPDFGDLNFDNVAFTTADAVIFTNYLVYGWDAFNNLPEVITQDLIIQQSDINQDGVGLTLADLVLLIQIGRDTGSIPYSLNSDNTADATIKYDNNRLWVSTPCAAAHIVVPGEVQPTLLTSNMTMLTGTDGQYTSILVFSWDPAQTFDGTFMILDGDILALTMVDASGVQFAPTLIPTTWSLSQNYPNPFNPITTIEFTLPKRTHIDLEIFNVSGQRVGLTSGVFGPGEFQTTWDGSDHASGVYWYRLTTDEFTASRKMLLIK